MITEKQKCIAEQAIYGDLMLNRRAYDDVEEKYIIEQVDSKWVLDFINWDKLLSLTPILRPMSDLTKEITHKGYNDNKPFIQIKHMNFDFDKKEGFIYSFNRDDGYLTLEYDYFIDDFDLLNQLHFDTRDLISKGEAIDVNSLPNNPYAV